MVGSRLLVVDLLLPVGIHLTVNWLVIAVYNGPVSQGYLMPSPSLGLTSCLRTELRYDAACTLQGRLLFLSTNVQCFPLTRSMPHLWTLHSGRNVLPSATSALHFDKSDRDFTLADGPQKEGTCLQEWRGSRSCPTDPSVFRRRPSWRIGDIDAAASVHVSS